MQAGGWSNLEMLTRRYGKHSFSGEREKMAEKMDSFLNSDSDEKETPPSATGTVEQALQSLLQMHPDLLIEIARSIQTANKE